MIPGNATRKIKSFLFIDHMGEGLGRTTPKEGEEFVGILGWHSSESHPFIQVQKDGKVVRTINALDISEIEFEVGS
uniref:Uncharacterized protein n=1 Tax=viral metagenome TaxID=1070528 RepID=A0A6M3JPS5_9ZZZZ